MMPYTSTQCCLITELDGVRLPEVYVTACETEFPVKIEYSDAKKDNGVKEVRMQYIQKCYDDIVQLKPELKLPSWPDFKQKIESQTFSLSKPFTFPVEPVSLDLTEIDELVRKESPSTEAGAQQKTT